MKANPSSSGLVILYFYVCIVGPFLVLHLLVLLLHLKKLLARVVMKNPARGNNSTCCTLGECNCACMPVLNPFGHDGLFSLCIPCVLFNWFIVFPWFLYKCFLWYNPFFGFSFISFIFLCCDYGVVCFPFVSVCVPDLSFLFLFLKKPLSFVVYLFCEICVYFPKWCCSASWVSECTCKCRMK